MAIGGGPLRTTVSSVVLTRPEGDFGWCRGDPERVICQAECFLADETGKAVVISKASMPSETIMAADSEVSDSPHERDLPSVEMTWFLCSARLSAASAPTALVVDGSSGNIPVACALCVRS